MIEINDSDTFTNEGKSYLEFALLYGSGSLNKNQSSDLIKKDEDDDVKENWPGSKLENLDLCVNKC